jgi:hypothetical protein
VTDVTSRRTAAVALATALVLAACGGSDGNDAAPAPTQAPTQAATESTAASGSGQTTLPAGDAAPASTQVEPPAAPAPAEVVELLKIAPAKLGGGTIDLAQYAGRPVAFWFWAPG